MRTKHETTRELGPGMSEKEKDQGGRVTQKVHTIETEETSSVEITQDTKGNYKYVAKVYFGSESAELGVTKCVQVLNQARSECEGRKTNELVAIELLKKLESTPANFEHVQGARFLGKVAADGSAEIHVPGGMPLTVASSEFNVVEEEA